MIAALLLMLCTSAAPEREKPLSDEEVLPKDPRQRLWGLLHARHFPAFYWRELSSLAPKFVPELLEILKDKNSTWTAVARTMSVVPELGDKRFQFVPLVTARLKDKDDSIRRAAIACLSCFPNAESRAAILPLIADGDLSTAYAAGRALAEMGTEEELKEMRTWVELQLSGVYPHRATHCIRAHADELEMRLTKTKDPAFNAPEKRFLYLLTCQFFPDRYAKELSEWEPLFKKEIVRILADKNAEKIAVARLLGALPHDSENTREYLPRALERLADKSPMVRIAAIDFLGTFPEHISKVRPLIADTDASVARSAGRYVVYWGNARDLDFLLTWIAEQEKRPKPLETLAALKIYAGDLEKRLKSKQEIPQE